MWVIARFILETRNYDQIEKSFYLREMKMYNRIKNGVKAWTKGMGGEKKKCFPILLCKLCIKKRHNVGRTAYENDEVVKTDVQLQSVFYEN